MTKPRSSIIRIARYTLIDEVRQKSFIVMFILCALFIFLVRGCYQGNYMMNGQDVEAGRVVIMVSKITFHVIALGVMFLAALLSMRIFRREREDGTQSCILSKPITRRQYVAGKVLGLWILLVFFQVILHGIVFLITSLKMNLVMPDYLIASLVCSVNLLFIIITVLLLSLMMPDIAALLCVMFVGIIGLVVDGVFAMRHSPMAQAMMQQQGQADIDMWQVLYYVWPKLPGSQRFASSLIGAGGWDNLGPVYPLANVLVYCLLLGALLFLRFRREDIA